MHHPETEGGTPTRWRRLWPVLIWLIAMAAAVVVTVRSRYVADLSAFLPEAPTPEQRVLLDQLRNGATSRLILIGVRAEGTEPTEAARAASTRVSRELGAALRGDARFEVVHNGDLAASEALGRFLYAHRYRFSPAIEPARFTEQGLRDAIDDTLLLLGTPAGRLVKPLLFEDPTGESVRMAQAMTPATAPASRDGVWVSRDGRRAVLLAFTRAEGADMDGQAAAVGAVRDAFERLSRNVPAAQRPQLELSGPGVMGMQSRQMIEQEVDRLAKLGTAIMVGLLLLSFGSLRALSVALLPVASGVLAGIASVSLIFGEVHGFTLGFGTTLIGEAVDYAIYYLIQAGVVVQGAEGGARGWLRSSWPTVRLGLWTSLAGFAALALSGFGGLAQLGVFSMAGLAAAALTTRWVLTRLAPQGATGRGMRPWMGRFMQAVLRVWPRTRVLWWLALLGAAAWTVATPSPWTGNLSTMSTISAKDSALDESLRADLGAADGGVLLAVEAASEAEVLARAEAVGRRLDALVAAGRLVGYDSPARWLPSPDTQRQRLASLPAPEVLRERLRAATADGALPASRLEPFVAAVSAQRGEPLLDWSAMQSTPLAPMLNAQMLPARTDPHSGRRSPWTVLMNLHLPEGAQEAEVAQVADAMQAAVKDVPEVRLVRINPELNALYGHYLHEAGWQAGAGAVLVVVLLAWHLRSARRLWNVVLPLLVSGLLVHAGLALADARLGILHLVGFLLVAAVGSNYALFFDHLQEEGAGDSQAVDPDTLASLLLANLTTVLSFGLLAGSDMPALAAIGQVVAPGALLSLWMAAAFAGRPARVPRAAPA